MELGQVQLGLTSTKRYGENANLLLCSKNLEFSFKDMQTAYSRALHYPSFPWLLGLQITLLVLSSCYFFKLNEKIHPRNIDLVASN